jgi:hypothetical protein
MGEKIHSLINFTSRLKERNGLGNLDVDGSIILNRSENKTKDIYSCYEQRDKTACFVDNWNLLTRCYSIFSDIH